jgi:hypothetical protein
VNKEWPLLSLIYYSIWITFKLILYFLIFFFIKLRVGDFAFRLHGPLVQIRIIPSPLGWGYVSNAYSPSDGSALRQLCGPAYRGPAVGRCRPSAAAENHVLQRHDVTSPRVIIINVLLQLFFSVTGDISQRITCQQVGAEKVVFMDG